MTMKKCNHKWKQNKQLVNILDAFADKNHPTYAPPHRICIIDGCGEMEYWDCNGGKDKLGCWTPLEEQDDG